MSTSLGTEAPANRLLDTGAKVVALGAAQVAVYSFPVVFAVVCARNLGASQYGVVAFYTALTSFLCMFIEFGFDSIGVREVHSSGWRARPAQVFWNVTLAKLIICLPTCALVLPIVLATRSPAEGSMSYAMVLYMFAFALEPSWYLRSLEMMWSAACAAVVSRTAGIVLLVGSVNSHDDLTRAMWAYAFVAWASAACGWVLMRHLRLLRAPQVDPDHLRSLFRSGAAMVVGNLGGASITSGGVAVLGAIADPVVTGAANMALRIRSAGLAILIPLSQLGHVRLSALASVDRVAAVRLGRQLFYMLMASSLVIALLISVFAESITAFAYGLPQAPEAATSLVQLMAVGLPACVAGVLFGWQCLTLFHQERAYVLIETSCAALFFALLFAFFAASPVAFGWALLAADVWTALAAGWCIRGAATSHESA